MADTSMKQRDRARSVARGTGAPGRFDGVKLELAVAMLFAMAAAIVVAVVQAPPWLELLVLAAVGFTAGGWVAVRTRRVADAERDPEEHG